MQTVNLSATAVREAITVDLNNGWELTADTEIDTICVNGRDYNLGYIVSLNIDSSKGNSFTVYEFVERKEDGATNESNNDFATYNEAVNFISTKVDAYINAI